MQGLFLDNNSDDDGYASDEERQYNFYDEADNSINVSDFEKSISEKIDLLLPILNSTCQLSKALKPESKAKLAKLATCLPATIDKIIGELLTLQEDIISPDKKEQGPSGSDSKMPAGDSKTAPAESNKEHAWYDDIPGTIVTEVPKNAKDVFVLIKEQRETIKNNQKYIAELKKQNDELNVALSEELANKPLNCRMPDDKLKATKAEVLLQNIFLERNTQQAAGPGTEPTEEQAAESIAGNITIPGATQK